MSEDAPRGEEDPAVVPPADPWASNATPNATPAPNEPTEPVEPDAAPPAFAPGGTGILPAVPGPPSEPAGPTPPAEPPRWSARAQVRTPEPDADAYTYAGAGWEDDRPPRGVMTPVLITIAVVLLLLLIGTGLWLVLRDPGGGPTPAPTQPTTVRPTVPSTTRPAPTTTPPPQTVPVPGVRGLTYAAAAAIITDSGFVPARSDEPSLDVPAGRVIGTTPPEGNQVRQGTTVTITVSTGPPAAPTTAASPSGAAT